MTLEAELAQLLIRMGTERGLDIESILAELAWTSFPSFVDANAVRGSTLEVVESWWRADLEERLGQLRRQFVQGAEVVQPEVSAPRVESKPTPAATSKPPVAAQPKREPVAQPVVTNQRQSVEQPVTANQRQPLPDTMIEPLTETTIHDQPVPPAKDPSEAMPRDATMIWNTRHG